MGVTTYTPTGISHTTSVDFSKRSISQPVHIVQYDRSLPILAVSLYNNGQLYRLPESTRVSIRFGKPDKTFVYNPALGCNQSRTIVYFEITQQMTLFHGEFYPVIELMDGEKNANSSTIYIIIDKNPIQHDYIESTVEYKELIEYRNEAISAAQKAKASETNANDSENAAAESASAANKSKINAADSEKNAELSAQSALESKSSAEKARNDAVNMVEDVTQKLESGYFIGPKGDKGEKGEKGDTGEKGEKGDTGESGITSPVSGFFTLSVDADGNLWSYSADGSTSPDFEYDSETGSLYIVQEVS